MEERNELYRKLFKKYGNLQLVIAIEELAELQKELTKSLRGLENKFNIIEEVADVYIILEQLEMYFGLNKDDIKDKIEEKINRTSKYVN